MSGERKGSIECAVVLVDKPAGVTSHDVVFRMRRELSEQYGQKVKTGHAGTLDPFATGLLVVLVGRAARLQQYLQHQPKTYVATARLGWRSSSGDSDGELTHTGVIPDDPQLPVGELELPVPKLSAIKVEGQRLYAKARKGEDFEPPLREMTVYRADRMELGAETAVFEIDCTGGTYIRSVVDTLKDAYCSDLRRTKVGELRLEDADGVTLLEPLNVLAHLPQIELSHEQGATLVHGRRLEIPGEATDPVRLVVDGRLLGVGRHQAGRLTAETILASSVEELLAR